MEVSSNRPRKLSDSDEPVKDIVRVYYGVGMATFKTLELTESTTAANLCARFAKKIGFTAYVHHLALKELIPNGERWIGKDEKMLTIKRSWDSFGDTKNCRLFITFAQDSKQRFSRCFANAPLSQSVPSVITSPLYNQISSAPSTSAPDRMTLKSKKKPLMNNPFRRAVSYSINEESQSTVATSPEAVPQGTPSPVVKKLLKGKSAGNVQEAKVAPPSPKETPASPKQSPATPKQKKGSWFGNLIKRGSEGPKAKPSSPPTATPSSPPTSVPTSPVGHVVSLRNSVRPTSISAHKSGFSLDVPLMMPQPDEGAKVTPTSSPITIRNKPSSSMMMPEATTPSPSTPLETGDIDLQLSSSSSLSSESSLSMVDDGRERSTSADDQLEDLIQAALSDMSRFSVMFPAPAVQSPSNFDVFGSKMSPPPATIINTAAKMDELDCVLSFIAEKSEELDAFAF